MHPADPAGRLRPDGRGHAGRLARAGACPPSVAVDPAPEAAALGRARSDRVCRTRRPYPPDFAPAAVVLAVKPQNAAETLPLYRRSPAGAVFLSIMAGRTIGGMRALLGDAAAIVRAMPNTPAAVRQGMTVACPGQGVTAAQRELCETLLQAIGGSPGSRTRPARSGHGRIGQRPGLCVPAGRVDGAGGA